jgi:transcriptional regulator with XRE-family HTH domain
MSTRERPVDRGARLADLDRVRAANDIREARPASGISIREVARAAGMSASQASRIEHGRLATVSIDQIARVAAVVGLDARLRVYPGPDPIRDAAQVALLERLRARLPSTVRMRTEVPLPIPGDLRALDGVLDRLTGDKRLPVEAETRLHDAQAQTRRQMLKIRDAGFDHLLVVVSDTRRNREAVRAAETVLREMFPLSARQALAALGAGRHPGGSAIVLL